MNELPFPVDEGKEAVVATVLDELLALPCSESVRFKLGQLIGTLHFHFNAAARRPKTDRLLGLLERRRYDTITKARRHPVW